MMNDFSARGLFAHLVSRIQQALRHEPTLWVTLGLAASIVVAVGITSYDSIRRLQDDSVSVAHTQEVIANLERVLLLTTEAEAAVRGYVITEDASYLQPYKSAAQSIRLSQDKLGTLIVDNSSQTQRFEELTPLVQRRFELLKSIIEASRQQGFNVSRTLVTLGEGKLTQDAIRRLVTDMKSAEDLLLINRLANSKQSTQRSLTAATLSSVLSLGLLGAVLYFMRRAIEEERKSAEARAAIDQAKTDFFSNVSHEFRTPLSLIIGPLESLSAAHINDADSQLIDLARRNAQRLLKLVNSMLDFARIEAGRVDMRYTSTDLANLTGEMASMFASSMNKANITFTVDCPPLPEPVYVDTDMWEKIVLNLIANAFKFTFEGNVTVRLRWQQEEEGGKAVLTVTDTGVGIPEEHLPRLFERFHRVPNARSRTPEGTGIGLALVHELVKLHGGTIAVDSTPDVGTTFTVSIPGGTAHLPAERINAEPVLASTAINARAYVEEPLHWLPDSTVARHSRPVADGEAPRPRILWADDSDDMRAYVRGLLLPYWDVEAVADGQQALDAALRDPPDLVLSDVMMPNLDGFGLLQALRTNPRTRSTPVILLSAQASEDARVQGLEAGADDYLSKPFSARELLARIETHLGIARLRQEAVELALHDALTGLPNRKLCYEFAERLLEGARRRNAKVAVLFIDMDRFKPINDTYGHEVGDALLKEVARRLKACVRSEDTAGRLGGDEFLVVLANIGSAADAAHAAQHLVDSLCQPYCVRDLSLHSSPSIGISLFPDDGSDIGTLLQHADVAMYHAKEQGRSTYQLYSSAMNESVALALRIESQMRSGLEQRQFQLHYQPIIDVAAQTVTGAEALMRWPAAGIGPGDFIAVAETNGMIGPLGEWGLTEACRQARQWRDNGLPALRMSVNVSPLQFRLQTFYERVEAALREYDIPPSSLQLEVTETALLKNPDEAVLIMRRIKQLGVKFALDDFGKGYSSLSRLGQLPLDTIKVDQEFVMKLASGEPTNAAITDAIIAISKTLGLSVVAEGVESAEVQALLCDRDCSQMQGYYLSPPLPAAEFETWYRRHRQAA